MTELGEEFGDQAGRRRRVPSQGVAPRREVVLERNEHYWEEGLPKLDGVEWHVVVR